MAGIWLGMKTKKRNLIRESTSLAKDFTVSRATLFCFGAIIGVDFYTEVANSTMNLGPLATSWYVIGGIVAVLVGMCYAELASLAPCAGGVYEYSYHTMGQLMAFLTGWVMILSLSAKVIFSVRSLTTFIDKYFFDSQIANFSEAHLNMYNFSETSIFESTPDLSAFPLSLLIGGLYSTFSKGAAITNSIICLLNIIIMTAALIMFMYFTDFDKMHFGPTFNKTTAFFSKGFSIAQSSYAGLELGVFLGEEAVDPSVTIPKAILTATVIAILFYSVISFIYSLLPRKVCIRSNGSLIQILKLLQVDKQIGWLICIGGICSMIISTYARMFSLIRLIYSMSKDGMLFPFSGWVQKRTKTPLISIYTMVTLLGLFGTFIKLKYILELTTYYTSLEYFMITTCVLITRYRCEQQPKTQDIGGRWFLINYPRSLKQPTRITERTSSLLITTCIILVYIASVFLELLDDSGAIIFKIAFVVSLVLFLVFGILLGQQPQNNKKHLHAYIGASPYRPLFVMAYAILMLVPYTYTPWAITLCWLLVGLMFYFAYSCWHSVESGHVLSQNPEAS